MKSKVKTLRGHSNWVKNIEYQSQTGRLITSGFDGSIYMWNINQCVTSLFLCVLQFPINALFTGLMKGMKPSEPSASSAWAV
jgi:WD repeat-containing protein 32